MSALPRSHSFAPIPEPAAAGSGRAAAWPGWDRTDTLLALAALLLRVLPVAALFLLTSTSWEKYLSGSDAGSFVPVAKFVYGLEPLANLKTYDTRVFPGWPLAIGLLFKAGLPEWSALALSLLCAAVAPVVFRRVTGDSRLAWLLVYFSPAWLLAGFHPISESAYVLLILLLLAALKLDRPFLAGILAGAMFAIRPFGIAWAGAAGLALLMAYPRQLRHAALYTAGSLLPVVGLVILNLRIFGSPWHQLEVYGLPLDQLNVAPEIAARLGQTSGHWGLPFRHLLATPWIITVPVWKIAYIYAHAAALLALVFPAIRSLGRNPAAWERALAIGFLANGALIVSTGPYWGFYSFDRYFVWGLPGALWLGRAWIPAGRWHLALALPSFAFALYAFFAHAGG